MVLFLISILFSAVPVSAVTKEITVAGIVTEIMPSDNTMEIKAERVWNGATWTGVSVTFVSKEMIKGTVPNSAVFDKITAGSPVQATFTGDEEQTVTWKCIGKVQTGGLAGKYISDAFGDPKYVISPFFNNFKITYTMLADCDRCSGSTCTADYADLHVSQGWEEKNYAYEYTIKKGERHVFTSPEGCESEFSVTFIEGESSTGACPGYPATPGPAPVSNFVISVVQKGTVSDMTPAPAITPVMTGENTPQPTQSPGFVYMGALAGIFAAVLIARIKKY